MEQKLSIGKVVAGLAARMAGSGLQCSLLALLAFLPIGGLALLSPEQVEAEGSSEFGLAALLLSRILTPPVAALIVAYLARKDGRLATDQTLWRVFRGTAFPSVGVVLGVGVFGAAALLLLVVPGVAFLLATSVVVPVLVVEGVSSPVAVKRSWELTREKRWPLLLFWSGYHAFALAVLATIVMSSSSGLAQFDEPLPLVQTDAFLPLIFAGSILYAGLVTASYEIYRQVVKVEELSDR